MNVRKMITVTFVVLFIVSLCVPAGVNAQQPKREKLSFSIVTAGTVGVWYMLGGAIGGVIKKYVPNTEATSEATTGSIDNMKLLIAGEAGMGFAYDYHVAWANEGKVTGIPGKNKIRLVMGCYEQPLHIVTKEGTGITSMMQLKGKRVSTGAPNSGSEEQAEYIFKALGIDIKKDIKQEKLGLNEAVGALKDDKIDAFMWSIPVPTGGMIDLASTPGLKVVMVPLGGELADKVMKAKPGVFHKVIYPKGCYNGVERDVEGLGITGVLLAMDTFPEDRLYEIVKAIFNHKDELTAVFKGVEKMTPATAVGQVTPDALKYLHPGAQRFFKEKGVLK